VSEDVAENFEVDPRVDLPRGVAVPQRMATKDFGIYSGFASVCAHQVADRTGRHWGVREMQGEKERPRLHVVRPLTLKVGGDRFRHGRQQR
jgi:hypothetical protein